MERKKFNCYERRLNRNLRSRVVSLKILLAGDSFAAKWPGKNGWPELLASKHTVTNVAQAGVSEYKILNQIKNSNLDLFDYIIVSHTSPSRVHTREHPIHKQGLHKDCDLIYNDICERNNWFNPSLRSAQDYFKYHYDDEYQIDMYLLIRQEIQRLLGSRNYLSITHSRISTKYAIEHDNISFSALWQQHRGKVNHYTEKGNLFVYKDILDTINK
jgi:hypothetical protein